MKSGVPIIGFCGYSGSGKTVLLEKVARRLIQKGLKVGYLKHDAHRLQVDREGKDTDRLFKCGVQALAATSDDQLFTRIRPDEREFNAAELYPAFAQCDILLVEGYKNAPWEKIWVHPHSGGSDAKPALDNLRFEIGGRASLRHDDIDLLCNLLVYWLIRNTILKPLFGGVLVGGKSARMGTPKALIETGGATLVERAYSLIKHHTNKTYLLGTGPLPPPLSGAERISDPPDIEGPLAGLVAAHRFAPYADWLILAVDMPNIDSRYIRGLIDRRKPGIRFIGAHNPTADATEPLAAIYSSQLLHSIAASRGGELSISRILQKLGVKGNPELFNAAQLENVNTPDDMKRLF